MSGAILGGAARMVSEMGKTMGVQKSNDHANSFSSMLGGADGGNSGAGGAPGGEAGGSGGALSGMLSGIAGGSMLSGSLGGGGGAAGGAGGAGASGGSDGSEGPGGADKSGGAGSSGGMDQLKQTAMQDIAQQSPDLLQHYNLDIKNGDGNAAAGDLASIAKKDTGLQKDVGVLAATVGTDAEPGGGGKLSGHATHDLQAALPDAKIDVGSNAINRAGDSIKKSADSGLQSMAGGFGSFLKSAESKVGQAPGLLSGT